MQIFRSEEQSSGSQSESRRAQSNGHEESPLRSSSFSSSFDANISSTARQSLARELNEVVRGLDRVDSRIYDLEKSAGQVEELSAQLRSTFSRRLWGAFGVGVATTVATLSVSEAAGPLVFAGMTAYAVVDYIRRSETELSEAVLAKVQALRALLSTSIQTSSAVSEYCEHVRTSLSVDRDEERSEYAELLMLTYSLLEKYFPEIASSSAVSAEDVGRFGSETGVTETGADSGVVTNARIGRRFLKTVQNLLEFDAGRNRIEVQESLESIKARISRSVP